MMLFTHPGCAIIVAKVIMELFIGFWIGIFAFSCKIPSNQAAIIGIFATVIAIFIIHYKE